MAKKTSKKPVQSTHADQPLELPPGVKLLHTFKGHEATVTTLAFDPRGKVLASGDGGGNVRLWDTPSGKQLCQLDGHIAPVLSVAFDPRGATLISVSADETVKVWDVASCE